MKCDVMVCCIAALGIYFLKSDMSYFESVLIDTV